MKNCGGCGKFVSPAGSVTCSSCPLKYHRACLALPDKALISKDWVCPGCKRGLRKGDNSQTPVKCMTEEESGVSQNPTMANEASDDQVPTKLLERCLEEMKELRREMKLLNENVATFSSRVSAVEDRLSVLERERVDEGESEKIAVLERTVSDLRLELNDRDQDALLADLDIGHLPEEKGESATQAVTVLATRLGVVLEERDVVFAERVGAPPAEGGRPRRVVVRLARRSLRDDLLRAARVRRTVHTEGGGRVYINERLTRTNRQLFHRVREICSQLQWRFAWTRRGRVLVRQGEGKPVYQLRSEADFPRAFGEVLESQKH